MHLREVKDIGLKLMLQLNLSLLQMKPVLDYRKLMLLKSLDILSLLSKHSTLLKILDLLMDLV